jgi:catechol 2,3-dioxygenase-like lactoylglutathione lyase family enzyme
VGSDGPAVSTLPRAPTRSFRATAGFWSHRRSHEYRQAVMSVRGIGGFVFRAADPDGLRAWYAEHLGIGTGEHGEWATAAGPSVFAPFPRDSDYFAVDRQWMLNLRVRGLDAMVAALAAAGIEVTTNPDWDAPGVGRFARLHDPEGNPIELWEPDPADDAGSP